MRLSKKQYNEAISRLENLEKTINKGGGNPYHDELGRFTEGPSKAFGEYKADNDLVYGPSANYTGNPKDENNAYRPFAGKVGLADNDIVSTMTKDQVEATMQTMGALRKMKDAVKGISGENWANTPKGIAESALNTLMGYTYTVGYRSSHGKNPEPGEWSDAAWRTHRLDETEASTRALQKVAKANKAYASIAKAATAALNTMKYIEKNTDAKGKEHLYSVSKKTGVTERETPRNSLSSKADNLIAKMDKLINGGKGSGNFGHRGRPGYVGGSGKGDGKSNFSMDSPLVETIEDMGWNVDESGDDVVISKYSDAGEDFFFYVSKDDFPKGISDYAETFDADEHVQLWLDNPGHGQPDEDTLREDAANIKDELQQLAVEVELAHKEMATKEKAEKILRRDVVTIAPEHLNPGESADKKYVVMEDWGDRVGISSLSDNNPLPGTEMVSREMLRSTGERLDYSNPKSTPKARLQSLKETQKEIESYIDGENGKTTPDSRYIERLHRELEFIQAEIDKVKKEK